MVLYQPALECKCEGTSATQCYYLETKLPGKENTFISKLDIAVSFSCQPCALNAQIF